ncbi:MAG: hypothetical protein KGL39_32750 [Patescibacteria group bacterium]|nr:hypothetical protein [Patescibacteria group bacterium]
MEDNRLTRLRARTERANKISSDIEALRACGPLQLRSCKLSLRDPDSREALPRDLLERLFERGRVELVTDLVAELERLIGIEPADGPTDAQETNAPAE